MGGRMQHSDLHTGNWSGSTIFCTKWIFGCSALYFLIMSSLVNHCFSGYISKILFFLLVWILGSRIVLSVGSLRPHFFLLLESDINPSLGQNDISTVKTRVIEWYVLRSPMLLKNNEERVLANDVVNSGTAGDSSRATLDGAPEKPLPSLPSSAMVNIRAILQC